jgi:integrase
VQQLKVELWLRAMLEVGVTYAWRRGEVDTLKVYQIDLKKKTIDLDPGGTKNDEARVVRMTQQVGVLMEECIAGKDLNDLVFTVADGSPVGDFRKVWTTCCEAAGIERIIFHDLRRTGARNMRRMGIHESTIMKIAGWKTRSLFDRYNIVDQEDLIDAAQKMDARQIVLDTQKSLDLEFGHRLGIKSGEVVESVNSDQSYK